MSNPRQTASKSGENRTPDKTVGQVKYGDGQDAAHGNSGQDQARDNKEALQSQKEGPAAYAPHEEENIRAKPNTDPAKKKAGEF